MASINQFKLVKQKSESYFNILQSEITHEIKLSKESDKARFGFYLFILECITNIKDINDLLKLITDTEFNKQVLNTSFEDNGIDAIYINEDEKEISLYNFKYRENYNEDSKHSMNDVFISQKFTNSLISSNSNGLTNKLKAYAEDIIKCFDSNDVWKFKLYMVSNESKNLDKNDHNIEQLKELYDLEIIPISLSEINDFMSLRPEPICAKMILEKESILSYSEDALSSTKSYIIKLSIPDLLRITCNEKMMRNEYNLSDYTKLNALTLDYNILFDNVRGYLGDTKYNKNIFKTLKEEPNRFFMYNNGITITAQNIDVLPINANKKMQFDLTDIQIVNGGQTLRSLHRFNSFDKSNLTDYLANGEVLVRIFKTGNNPELTSKIAEYTNSQNEISSIDLKSIAHIQIQIEQFLEVHNIIYARKVGDSGLNNKSYKHKISMEKFAQILFSISGNPEKASNQKKKIFEKYYNDVFGEDNFNINESANIVNKYYNIQSIYKSTNYDLSDQKIFYIFYISKYLGDDILEIINNFENVLNSFEKDEEISPARKLIKKGFLDFLNDKLNIKESVKSTSNTSQNI